MEPIGELSIVFFAHEDSQELSIYSFIMGEESPSLERGLKQCLRLSIWQLQYCLMTRVYESQLRPRLFERKDRFFPTLFGVPRRLNNTQSGVIKSPARKAKCGNGCGIIDSMACNMSDGRDRPVL